MYEAAPWPQAPGLKGGSGSGTAQGCVPSDPSAPNYSKKGKHICIDIYIYIYIYTSIYSYIIASSY